MLGIRKKDGTVVFYNKWDKMVIGPHGDVTVYLNGESYVYNIGMEDVERLIDCFVHGCRDVIFVEEV